MQISNRRQTGGKPITRFACSPTETRDALRFSIFPSGDTRRKRGRDHCAVPNESSATRKPFCQASLTRRTPECHTASTQKMSYTSELRDAYQLPISLNMRDIFQVSAMLLALFECLGVLAGANLFKILSSGRTSNKHPPIFSNLGRIHFENLYRGCHWSSRQKAHTAVS
jgi:hypothetical protein